MNSILLAVWAVLVACFLALLAYRGQLERYEDEQLFLTEEVLHEETRQRSLVTRLQRLQPIVRLAGGAACAATVCAVGIYVWDAWQKIQS